MANKKERKCICCGKIYYYCPNGCEEDKNKPAWMFAYHSDNCRQLDHIASDYFANDITADEAGKMFKECDLSYIKSLHPKIQEAINDTVKDNIPEKTEHKKMDYKGYKYNKRK